LSYTEKKPGSGYLVGLKLSYSVDEKLNLVLSSMAISKNYLINRTGKYAGLFQKHNNLYIQLPLYCQFNFKSSIKINYFITSGLYAGFWASGRINGATANILNLLDTILSNGQIVEYFKVEKFDEEYSFNKSRDDRFDWGLLFGTGISYKATSKFSFYSELKFYPSLNDQQKKYMINQRSKHNQTYSLSIGCLMKIDFERENDDP
jgi:hypothetical protein